MERIYYIYCLINPINEQVFYIGYTSNPTKRFKDHLSHIAYNAKENKDKVKIIKSILDNKEKPLFKILQCFYGTKLEAETLETKHILENRNSLNSVVNITTIYNRSSDNGKKVEIISVKDNIHTLWDGVRECSNKLNIPHSNISNVLNGRRKSANGYNFYFKRK